MGAVALKNVDARHKAGHDVGGVGEKTARAIPIQVSLVEAAPVKVRQLSSFENTLDENIVGGDRRLAEEFGELDGFISFSIAIAVVSEDAVMV